MKWIRISRNKDYYHWPAWCCLMRINRPIGSLLLLWPTLWALWLAEQGLPHLDKLSIFILGVFFMRSAGCVINDYFDRNIDRHVQRTNTRPLPNRAISEKTAKLLFSILACMSFCLVLMLNIMTIGLSIVALALTWIYPLMKRYMDIPQLVLGIAFSWSIPMVFAAISESLPVHCWLLFISNVAWTVAYDTQYALIDKDDDLRIGIKSTAVLFGKFDKIMISVLQFLMLLLLGMMGWWMKLGTVFYLFLVGSAVLFIHQTKLLSQRNKKAYLEAFSNNNRVGILILMGIILNYTSIY